VPHFVYNTSAYDSMRLLQLLDGLVDIYMPDFKFWSPSTSLRLALAKDYPQRAREAIAEMQRQVGPLKLGPAERIQQHGRISPPGKDVSGMQSGTAPPDDRVTPTTIVEIGPAPGWPSAIRSDGGRRKRYTSRLITIDAAQRRVP
jgi:hypothetical protein